MVSNKINHNLADSRLAIARAKLGNGAARWSLVPSMVGTLNADSVSAILLRGVVEQGLVNLALVGKLPFKDCDSSSYIFQGNLRLFQRAPNVARAPDVGRSLDGAWGNYKWGENGAAVQKASYGVFFQRARAAFLAIADRRLAESLRALAAPPLRPPSFPRATAAGFLAGGVPVRAATASKAATFSSGEGLLERLGILPV